MAVIEVKERFQERDVNESLQSTTYLRVFRVQTDDKNDGAYTVKTADDGQTRIPVLNEVHPEDDRAIVTNITAKPQQSDQKNWLVNVTYTVVANTTSWGGNDIKPWEIPPKVSASFAGYSVAYDVATQAIIAYKEDVNTGRNILEKNRDGSWKVTNINEDQPVVNSALVPFDPGLIAEKFNLVIQIEEARQIIDPDDFMSFNNSVNDSPITIADVKVGKYQGRLLVEWSNAYYGQKEYWNIRWNIEVNREGFIRILNDAGLVERIVNDLGQTRYAPIKVKDPDTGEETNTTEPLPLDGNGRYAKENESENGKNFYRSYITNPLKNWGPLSIPTAHQQGDKDEQQPEKDDA